MCRDFTTTFPAKFHEFSGCYFRNDFIFQIHFNKSKYLSEVGFERSEMVR